MQVLRKQLSRNKEITAYSTYKYSPNTNKQALTFSHFIFILKTIQQKKDKENQCLSSQYWIRN